MNTPNNFPELEESEEFQNAQRKVITYVQENMWMVDEMDPDDHPWITRLLNHPDIHRSVMFQYLEHPMTLEKMVFPFLLFREVDSQENIRRACMPLPEFCIQNHLLEAEERIVTHVTFGRIQHELANDLHFAKMRGQKTVAKRIRATQGKMQEVLASLIERIS